MQRLSDEMSTRPLVLSYPLLVATLLAVARDYVGVSQASLAKKIGMTQGPLGRIELGKAGCTVEQLCSIASGLRTKPGQVLTEADAHAEAAQAAGIAVAASPGQDDVALRRGTVLAGLAYGPSFWPALAKLAPLVEPAVLSGLGIGDPDVVPTDLPNEKQLVRMIAETIEETVESQLKPGSVIQHLTLARRAVPGRESPPDPTRSLTQSLEKFAALSPVLIKTFAMGSTTAWLFSKK